MKFTHTQDLFAYVIAGRGIITIQNPSTDCRFTYKFSTPKNKKWPIFVSVLYGPDNSSNYTYLGTIFPKTLTYKHGFKSTISMHAKSAKAFSWFFKNINNPNLVSRLNVWHEGICCRCGRKLTVPSSIESGIGPECAEKI